MRILETRITINASPQKVWEVLTDFENYPKWNPYIRSVSGDPDRNLILHLHFPRSVDIKFKVHLVSMIEEKELKWEGSFLYPGIFVSEQFFVLKANGDNSTTLIHGELFGGIVIAFFDRIIALIEQRIQDMNEALKNECEHSHQPIPHVSYDLMKSE